MEIFIAHNVSSPYREMVLREFQRQKIQLNMDVEMPTVESIRKLVQRNEGVAFLPHMCVEQELEQGTLREIKVKELEIERKIYLVYPSDRSLSHAARAFLELVRQGRNQTSDLRAPTSDLRPPTSDVRRGNQKPE
jgi:DNA-binding transcriptional LysR family regulator